MNQQETELLDKSHKGFVEQGVVLYTKELVTIPLTGKYEGIAIYVASSSFTPFLYGGKKCEELIKEIVEKLELK